MHSKNILAAGLFATVLCIVGSPVWAQSSQGQSSGAGLKLGQMQDLVGKMRGGSDQGASELAQLLQATGNDIAATRADLAATRAALIKQGVSATILARHDALIAQFEQRAAEFDRAGKGWLASQNPQTLGGLADFLQKYPNPKRNAAAPATLPWGAKPAKRLPAESQTAWYQRLTRDFRIDLAQAGMTTIGGVRFSQLPEAGQEPKDADLAETAEVTLTPAVRAQAQALGNNPVQIDNWVRNNVQWQPTWGALQTADMTLRSMRGNAFDIASLEIALLRASGIPARYQFGTIEVPAAALQNWVGGAANAQAAVDLLQQGGIAARGIESAGAVTSVRMEHVWVSAYVNWSPSRGVRDGGWNLAPPQHANPNAALNAWAPLDASYKQHDSTDGMNLAEVSPFNAQSVFDAARSGAACTAGSASRLNVAALSSSYASFAAAAKSRLDAAAGTVAQVLGSKSIQARQYPMLAGVLPYPTIVTAVPVASISSSQQWSVQVGLVDGLNTVFAASRTWEEVDGHSLSLSFVPETDADAQTLTAMLAGLPSRIPAYLVKVKAQLLLDGAVIGQGGSYTLGQSLTLRTAVQGVDGGAPVASDATIAAGETHVWAIRGQAQGPAAAKAAADSLAQLRARFGSSQLPSGAEQATTVLGAVAASYQALSDARSRLYQRVGRMIEVRLPSIARASSRFEDESVFGLVTYVRSSGVGLHVDRYATASATQDAAASGGAAGYRQQALQRASLTAQQVLDAAFGPGGTGAQSALSALALAAQSQTVLRADATTLNDVLGAMDPSSTLRDEISAAVAGGQEALLPATATDMGGLPMDALILREPQSGVSAYWVTSRNVPVVQLTAQRPGLAGWLGLADAQSAQTLVAPAVDALIAQLNTAQALVGDIDKVNWTSFAGRTEVIDGLYQSRIAASASGANACDWLITAVAGQLGAGLPASQRVNQAPVIDSAPIVTATSGQPYAYAVAAHDADGDALTFALSGAPTGMNIDAAGRIAWASPTTGQFNVTLNVSDGIATATQNFTLTVSAAPPGLQLNPSVSPLIADAGQNVTLASGAVSTVGPVTVTATMDGAPIALSAQGIATFAAPAAGAHPIVVTAGDGRTTLTRELILTVKNAGDTALPTASIASPEADTGVRGIVAVSGTATDANFAYYRLLLRKAGDPDTAWQEIGRGLQPVSNGVLGQIDTSRYANNTYQIGLIVVDVNGAQQSAAVTVDFVGNLKLGQFRLSFADVRAEAPGLPLMLTRTYDSTKKDVSGDFGWGWSASAQDITLRKNKTFGLDWAIETRGLQNCIVPVGKRRVSITLPDGGLYRFDAKNDPECQVAVPPPVNPVFTPVPGPTGGPAGRSTAGAQLRVIMNDIVDAQGGVLLTADGELWNPKDFELTTEENFKYLLKEGVGILSVTDPYGNKVDYGPGGYQHNANLAVTLTRDSAGRITQATDPAGKSLSYAYNAAGELVSITDRAGGVTKFTYASVPGANTGATSGNTDQSHLLSSITDPRGQVVMSNQFDEYGRLTGSSDGLGQASQQTFDTANNQQTVTDRRGNKTVYTFDADGNITQTVNALNQTSTATFDANGNETSTTDALGHTTKRTFDLATGKQTSETNALNQTTSTQYKSGAIYDLHPYKKMNPLSTTDARGNTTSYAYADPDQPGATPTAIAEPLGRSTNLGQDGKGNLTSLNIAGEATTYTYDSQGRKTKETNGLNQSTSYTYDTVGNELTRTVTKVVNGQTQTFTTTKKYDAENRLIEEVDALGGKSASTYNQAGKLATQTDSLGRTTTYTYDANARLTRTDYPDGTKEQTGYDAEGNEVSRTDRQGRVTKMEYDALNRLTKTTYPDGSSEGTEFDAAGRVIATIDRNGKRATMEYDDAGRQTASVDATGIRTSSTYDANGNRTSQTINGRTTLFEYDALNRLTLTTYPDGSTRSTVYRTDNRPSSQTDERGVTTTFGYDAAGRLTSVSQSGVAGSTTYGYDETGAKVKQVDALGRTTTWAIDGNGRITSRTIQDGTTETSQYDSAGNRLKKTTFAGEAITYQYDQNGRITSQLVAQGAGANSAVGTQVVNFTYGLNGQLLSQQEQGTATLNGVQSYTYDANDRLTKVSGPTGQISYGLDANGNITERSIAGFGTIKYGYDEAGRIKTVIAPDGKQGRYTYDAMARVATVERDLNPVNGQPQVLVTYNRYDAASRLIAIAEVKRVGATETVLAGQALTRGTGGTITAINTYRSGTYDATTGQFSAAPATTQAFEYDGNARLTRENRTVNGKNVDTKYEYDAAGNRTKKTVTTAAGTDITTYSYDAAGRLTTESTSIAAGGTSTTTYAWDGNGNLQAKIEPTLTTLYRFDPQNRLIDIRTGATLSQAQAAAPSVSYAYDAAGNRVKKGGTNASGYLIDSAYDYAQVANESGTSYVRGSQLLRQTKNGGTPSDDLFPLQGHQGTSLGAIDADGNLVEQIDGDAFGNFDQTGLKQTHLYTGEYFDKDSQLLYLRARWYEPKIGRFISADPFEGKRQDPRSLNRYAYAHGDPVRGRDPTGRMTLGEVSAADAAFGALAVTSILVVENQFAHSQNRSSVWDAVVATLAKAATDAYSRALPPEDHHTIPIYLCGSVAQMTSEIAWRQHKLIHFGLGLIWVRITVAEELADRLIPFGRRTNPEMMRFAETPAGRGVIAGLIGEFYEEGEFMEIGIPTIRTAFNAEKGPYIGGKTSLPACKRPR